MMIQRNDVALVADIGGTHARFAQVDLSTMQLNDRVLYACSEFESIDKAILHYMKEHALQGCIKKAVLAVACPILGDHVTLTNMDWQFSIRTLKSALGFQSLWVINDFKAIAYGLNALTPDDCVCIGHSLKARATHHPRLVIGAGTGLGVSCLLPNPAHELLVLDSEAGHMEWAPYSVQDKFVYDDLQRKWGRVSAERVLSGLGLETIYRTLADFQQQDITPLPAAEIARAASTGTCALAQSAVSFFITAMARFAGDLALAFSSRGGVYLAGGILPKLASLIDAVDFRYHFENKGRFSAFNKSIPTYVLTLPDPGLLGAAVYCQHMLQAAYHGVTDEARYE